MAVYILKIPGSEFTGYKGGVDFYKGKGSTSSWADAGRLISKFGCLLVELEPAIEIKAGEASAEASSGSSTPAGETPKETETKKETRKRGRKK
jgi:hypothetical protein